MAFATGAATGPTDLLDKLVTFLVAQGWTQDSYAVVGAGKRGHLHKNGNYINLRSAVNENVWGHSVFSTAALGYSIDAYVGTGYSGSSLWDDQAGGPALTEDSTANVGVSMPLPSGAILNYYFFSTGDDVVVVVEKSSSIYGHLGWGKTLTKYGTWTGGAYFFGSSGHYWGHDNANPPQSGQDRTVDCPGAYHDSHGTAALFVRVDVDAFTGKWVSFAPITTPGFCYTGKLGTTVVPTSNGGARPEIPTYGDDLYGNALETHRLLTSDQDARTNLMPVILWALRDGTLTGFSPIGVIPNVFVCNGVGRGFSKASDYVIGSDTYKLFPNFAVLKT